MPIRVIAKEGRDKSKSRMRGPRDEVYSDKEGRFKRDPKTRARKPMMGGGLMAATERLKRQGKMGGGMMQTPRAMYGKGGGVCKRGMGRAYGKNS